MKAKPSKYPFIVDKSHIYNRFIEEGISSINLGWEIFGVELHSELYCEEVKVDGVTEFESHTIKLEMNLSDKDARETIIHEIYHCMLEGCGLDEKNFDGNRMLLTNEQLVVALSKQTLLVHNLNPKLNSTLYA